MTLKSFFLNCKSSNSSRIIAMVTINNSLDKSIQIWKNLSPNVTIFCKHFKHSVQKLVRPSRICGTLLNMVVVANARSNFNTSSHLRPSPSLTVNPLSFSHPQSSLRMNTIPGENVNPKP